VSRVVRKKISKGGPKEKTMIWGKKGMRKMKLEIKGKERPRRKIIY